MRQVGGLKGRVVNGISWLTVSKVLGQVFTFISTAMLARLLSPADFGLMGIALVVTNFMDVLNQFGVATAIIQQKEMNDDVLSTVFWPNLAIGFLTFGVAFLLSANISHFFGAPAARPIIAVLAISEIIDSFGLVQWGMLQRELKFKSVSILSILGAIGYGLVAIPCALFGLGVWSLVMGNLTQSLILAIGFWFAVQWRPTLKFYWNYFKRVYGFGLKVLLNGIVEFFRGNSDYTLVGKVLGAYNLGIYTLSYNVATLAHTKITTVVRDTLTPAYSRIQDDSARLRDAANRAAQYLALIVFPVSFGLIVVAPEFIKLVYGTKWEGAILPAQILLFGGALLAVNPVIETIITAVGRPGVYAAWNAIRTAFLIVAIYIGLKLGGLVGVALGVTISIVIHTPITHVLSFSFIKGNVWRLWRGLGSIALISVLMAAGVFGLKSVLLGLVDSNVVLLLAEVLFGIILYVGLLFLTRPWAWGEILDFVIPTLRSKFLRRGLNR